MNLSRRSLLRAIPALLAAPAIVRVSSLMPIKALGAWPLEFVQLSNEQMWDATAIEPYITTKVLPIGWKLLQHHQFKNYTSLPRGV